LEAWNKSLHRETALSEDESSQVFGNITAPAFDEYSDLPDDESEIIADLPKGKHKP
jgi:hypothetical protein